MTTAKFVSYLRVSTDRQGRSGLGLEAQRAAVSEFVSGRTGKLVAEFVEVESGRRRDRPELLKALTACRIHKATLVVAKLDRLARNAHFLLGLKDSGVDFIACDMPSANRLTVGIMALVAEEEARLISARTKAALLAAKARGIRLGTPSNATAAGRHKGARQSAQTRIERADRRAADLRPTLSEIRSLGITTLVGIASELTRRGIAPARGGNWHATQVRRLFATLSSKHDM